MWGASPGTYKDLQACQTACLAYSMEEQEDWIPVQKENDLGDGKVTTHYRPCRMSDIQEAVKDHFYPINNKLEANIKEPMNITGLDAGDIRYFVVTGWKNPDGSINLGHQQIGIFPKQIRCHDIDYRLDEILEYPNEDNQNKPGCCRCEATYTSPIPV